MWININALHHWRVVGADGDMGGIADLLIDDNEWTAGAVLLRSAQGDEVRVPPQSVRRAKGEIGMLHVDVPREQLQSQQGQPAPEGLRSARALIGRRVEARDGDTGDLDELLVDEETWRISRLVVDARRWWPGGRVVIEPSAVATIEREAVRLNLTREQVRQSPAWR